MRRALVLCFVSLGATLALACGIFPTADGLTGGNAAPSDGARASDATPDGGETATPEGGCPIARGGPALVSVGAFCIDSTEVTTAQYAAFLADNGGSTAGQPPECAWNTDFAPSTGGAGGGVYDPIAHPNLPVNAVDWCDARAFCAWSGKRLCGAIGGGALPASAYADASAGQWQHACTHGGQRAYPYGAAYDASAGCNGVDTTGGPPNYVVDVGSRAGCVGGFPGVFDMSGNVWEWIDACSPCDGGRCCAQVGGHFSNTAVNLACGLAGAWDVVYPDDTRGWQTGFRCCSP